ncbi:hypothetical protein GJ496_006755 [Pomphorhynchus laevis]|nr:hypothetical protein GJ496_006755 [Pomphorhynchus laevis]
MKAWKINLNATPKSVIINTFLFVQASFHVYNHMRTIEMLNISSAIEENQSHRFKAYVDLFKKMYTLGIFKVILVLTPIRIYLTMEQIRSRRRTRKSFRQWGYG